MSPKPARDAGLGYTRNHPLAPCFRFEAARYLATHDALAVWRAGLVAVIIDDERMLALPALGFGERSRLAAAQAAHDRQ